MSLASGHHIDDTQSTDDFVVKSQKGKVKNPYLLYKDMHLTYLCPHMDEASKLLEYITVPRQWLPMGYRKLSLDPPLVDQVVNSVSSVVDPTLHLKSEVKVVELMSSPPDNLKTEVVTLKQSSSCPSLPVESEMKTSKFS